MFPVRTEGHAQEVALVRLVTEAGFRKVSDVIVLQIENRDGLVG